MYDDVIITIGMRSVAESILIRRHTSAPSIFGRSLSSRMTSGRSSSTRTSALAPSRAVDTTWPRPDSTLRIRRTTSGSSSMTRTRATSVAVDHRAQAGLRDRRLPVALVDEVRADVAAAIDQRALGHRLDAPRRRDLADVLVAGRRIEQHLERRAIGQRLAERGADLLHRRLALGHRLRYERLEHGGQRVGPGVVRRQRDHHEVVARHLARPRVELRLLGLAHPCLLYTSPSPRDS